MKIPPSSTEVEDSPVLGVKRPVFLLGIVSFLTDISSEMVYPLVPLFLTSVLGAPLAAVGLIEGVAESTASLLKTVSGWLSDRLRMRKPLVLIGYALSAAAKPLMAAANAWPAVLGVRFADRLGKGIRTAPRDALVADVTPAHFWGRAYGFHRAADTLGAVVGPAIGLGLLTALSDDFRAVFLIALAPAAAGLLLLMLVGEVRPEGSHARAPITQHAAQGLSPTFWLFLAVSLVFALGNSSDAFLILRSKNLGLSNAETVSAYLVFNAVYALSAMPAGIVSDRLGRRNIIGAGFALFALVYLGFALASSSAWVWPLFATYGLYMALTEGVGRALVVDFVPAARRATALGIYTGAMGGMILLSSIMAGALWDEVGPRAPFFLGSATAASSLVGLLALLPAAARGGVRPVGDIRP